MNMNTFKMSNLKKIREDKKITQTKLSTEIEVSQEIISHYEIGQSKPNIENLIKLADFFNCSTDYLLNRTNNPILVKSTPNAYTELNEFIAKYQMLNKDKQNHLISYLNFLISQN